MYRADSMLYVVGTEEGLALFVTLLAAVASARCPLARLVPAYSLNDRSDVGLVIRRRGGVFRSVKGDSARKVASRRRRLDVNVFFSEERYRAGSLSGRGLFAHIEGSARELMELARQIGGWRQINPERGDSCDGVEFLPGMHLPRSSVELRVRITRNQGQKPEKPGIPHTHTG
jgi:hypothetical protein